MANVGNPEQTADAARPFHADDVLLVGARGVSVLGRAHEGPWSSMVWDTTALMETDSFLVPLSLDELRQLANDGRTAPTGPLRQAEPGSRPDGRARLAAVWPRTCRVVNGGFEFYRSDGSIADRLTADEMLVLTSFGAGASVDDVRDKLTGSGSPLADDEIWSVIGRMLAGGIVREIPTENGDGTFERNLIDDQRRDAMVRLTTSIRHRVSEDSASADGRTPVIPVIHGMATTPPLALGMIMAGAKEHDGGRLEQLYDFQARWVPRRREVKALLRSGPAVFLFSNYVWSTRENMELSALVKELSPESLTIHGGPNTPRHPDEASRFLAKHPHVDIVARNEGEVMVGELLDALDGELTGRGGDLSPLADIGGIAFRHAGRIVRTPDRERLADLDQIPSPYLTGLFDDFRGSEMLIIETNRGCPYGCTFCDWGSATLSRIRKYSLERVFAELEWAAAHETQCIGLADANFGIIARDVEIAAKVAELKQEYGYPKAFYASKAKNTVKHLSEIIELLTDAGVGTDAILALQTTDEVTLGAVRRSNIKTATYDRLAMEYRQANHSLSTDLIVGLPGSTPDSLAGDLQFSVDREIYARVNLLELLVNSPMNEPEYRKEWEIVSETGHGDPFRQFVLSTSSYTRDDLDYMWALARFYEFAENLGLLRHIGRWVRHETGMKEVDLHRLIIAKAREPESGYPLAMWVYRYYVLFNIPPLSWPHFYQELRRMLAVELGLQQSSALDTVFAVQEALAPDRGRTFPLQLELAHDYTAWFHDMLAAKEDDPQGWPASLPPLEQYGPAVFTVDDPGHICDRIVGVSSFYDHVDGRWELSSPVGLATSELGSAMTSNALV